MKNINKILLLISIMLIGIPSILALPLNTTAYYKFNQSGSSVDAIDSSGNDYTLTATAGNGVQYIIGKIDNASNYTGGNLHRLSDSAEFQLSNHNFTIAFWINVKNNSDDGVIWANFNSNAANLFTIMKNGTGGRTIKMTSYGGIDYLETVTGINSNTWRRIVFTRNSSTLANFNVYVDGNLDNIGTLTNNLVKGMFLLGGGVQDYPTFEGAIDDFIFINGNAWSQENVTSDWNDGNGLEYDARPILLNSLLINYPTNTTYTDGDIYIESVTDVNASCIYSFDDVIFNSLTTLNNITHNTTITLLEDDYIINVTCSNQNNQLSSYQSFKISIPEPIVERFNYTTSDLPRIFIDMAGAGLISFKDWVSLLVIILSLVIIGYSISKTTDTF